MIVLSNISLALSDTSFDALNDPNQINFAYTLLDLHYAYDINFDTLGVETTASAWADIAVDFYANLTLPQTGFDAEITLGNGGFADQVIEVGDQVVFATRDYVFSGVTSSSFLDLSTLAFSTGFDVDVDAGISDITFDIPFGSDIVIDGLSIGTDGVQRFELLGFALDANAGEHFTSDVDPFEEALNDIPVESIMAGTYAVSQFPLDINWDFAALGFDETSQTLVPSIAGSSDFSVQNGSGDAFLEAVLDLDDLVAQYLLPGLSNPSNPLLSPFEFNWSSTIFEDTIWEVNPQLLATLLDLDLSIGVELVQQTSFDQTGTSVSVSQNGVDLATGSLGDTLSFDGLQSEGTGVYDVTYGASGDLTTSYGIIFTMDVPVTLMDVAFWNGDLEFDVDGHGFTTPQVPDDAWNFTVYDNTFRIGQSGFIPIPGMDSVTAVEFVSGIEQFEVEFTEDAWRAVSSSDPDVVVQNPADGSGASCDIIGTNGNDSLVGDDCDNLIDALAGRDTLIGGAGDDLLLVSYNNDAGDGWDSVDGGAGTDRAVYTLGGYATLYLVRFYDSEGNRFADTDDFDTIFDLSRDLANFSQIGLHGGSTSTFTNVEAIDIDATGGTRSNSAGEFWYLGGTTYLGSTRGYNDRFIANWSDQTNAVEWDFGSTAVQTLSNGITVGYMERMHVLFGSGNDDITGRSGADHIAGGGGNDTLDGGQGQDTLIGGAGDDLLLVSYNNDAGDGWDSVDGGAGTDRAVYTLGGYATLYLVRFYDSEGNRFADTDDFDTIFDLSRDLANFSQIGLHGGSTSTFTNVEAIDIDATGGTRSNSAGEFWYLGGTTYLGSTRGYNDRFIANWSDQTNAVEWDFGSTAVQTLSNGITVGYMERMHVLFGSGNDDITGRSGADHIAGGGGNDTLDGGQGQDTLIGGAGDDLLLVSYNNDAGDGWDSVDGGAGTDRAVYTLGGYATLYLVRFYDSEGNRFADTDDFDTIFDLSRDLANFSQIGLHGGSTSTFTNVEAIDIDATGGTRSNSAGEFWYLGGTTYLGSTRGYNDRFIANWSDQTNAVEWDVRTAGAQDLANGVTVGYFERVYLALGGGDDTVTGAGNADHIEGGGGDDLLDGSGGNDTLIGGADDDFLNGGEGSDLLVGGVGDDILGGGFGNDTYQITVGDGADLILDPDGGSVNLDGFDFDAAEFSRDGSVLQIDFTGSTDSLRILNYFSQSGDWRFYFDGVARDLDVADLFHPWDSLGRIVTRVDGDNSTSWHLFGAGEFVLMNGGQDVVYAGVGADLIDGGSATDVVSYIDSDAAVTVDLATQTGAGGFAEGDRYIAVEAFQGSNHDDQFYGSSEGDIFSGELGNDILLGADGDDTLNGGAGDDTLTGGAGNDAVDGGEGYDVAVLAIHYDQVEIEFSDGGFIITSDLGADFYINVDSFQFADVVKSADEITSQDLADISGSAGDDTLTGTNQSEVISAESGNDFLRGLGGDDMLFGMSGDDRLYGQAGDDTLVGGDGDDRLEGGAGADHIDGGSGRDIVQYVTATRSVRVDLQNPAISYNDAAGDTFVDVEVFQTGNTIDQLRGDAGANEFYTGGLSDRLYGRAGNDLLFGEDGADAFYGGLGADIMTGGSQAGRMDRFIYFDIRESGVGAGNRDIITDFVTGEDRIELSRFDADVTQGLKQRFVFVGNAELSGTAGELAYSYEGGNTIVQADTTGDGIANFEIELAGLLELSSGDFFI